MAPVPLDLSDAITAGANTLGTLIGGAVSQGYNRENMALQNEYAKELMDYQWQHFNSYKAQVDSMREAGLNPAVLYGKSAPSAASPSPSMPSSAPINVPSVFDLSSLSNYMLSVAQAKKAGMDTKLSEQEIKNKEVERQRNEFELDLRKQFGKDIHTAELANAYMQLVLASDTSDLNEQEKALNEWKIASEKAISQANEHQRDILKQNLDNNPTKLRLENRLTELQGSAAAAAAESSLTQAEVNRENRRLQSALAEIEEYGKVEKIKSLIKKYKSDGALSDADIKEADLKIERLENLQQHRDNSGLFEGVDNFSDWLKSKVSIFK